MLGLLSAVASGCGAGTASGSEPWQGSHPDPSGITFDAAAPGLCSLTARYPAEAPAAIEYQGATYVQVAKASAPAAAPGRVIGRSGGWTVSAAGGDVLVLTGSAIYRYRSQTSC